YLYEGKDKQKFTVDVGTVSHQPLTRIGNFTSTIAEIRSAEAGYPIEHIDTVEFNYVDDEDYVEYYTELPAGDFVDLCISYLKMYEKPDFRLDRGANS
ncbi:MAG: hypothetical protein JSW41_04660, partial [Candidatus Aenigmatarchaeota archaeon]